jgi:hypothetical protein
MFKTALGASKAYETARKKALVRERQAALKQWRIQVSGKALDFPETPKTWVSIDKALSLWSGKLGVYFVKNPSGSNIIYVGQTRKHRFEAIRTGHHHVATANDLFAFIEIDRKLVGLAESYYIKLLKPSKNTKSKYLKSEKLKGKRKSNKHLPEGVYRTPSGRYQARSAVTGLVIGRYSTPEKAAEARRLFDEKGEVLIDRRRSLPDGVTLSPNRPSPRKYHAGYMAQHVGWFATVDDAVNAIADFKKTGMRQHVRPPKVLPTGVYVRGLKYAAYAERNTYVGLYETPAQASAARKKFVESLKRKANSRLK